MTGACATESWVECTHEVGATAPFVHEWDELEGAAVQGEFGIVISIRYKLVL